MQNIILYLDMDCFFASCHQQGNPFLRHKPIAIIGNFQGGHTQRSVISSASKEAKQFGIKSGMALFQAKKLCQKIIFVQSEKARYKYISQRVFKIMAKYGDDLKIFSIDEAAITIKALNNNRENLIKPQILNSKYKVYEKALNIAQTIKNEIKEKLGKYLTCSIGISYNYVLAKLASDLSKPDGLKIILPNEALKILKTLAVDKISGIGQKTKEKLSHLGINSFEDLQNAPENFLKSHFGILGINLKNISLGKDSFYYHKEKTVKSIGHSETFLKDLKNQSSLNQYLQKLSEKIAFRLREKNLEGSTIHLTLRLKNFFTFSRQKKLDYFTCDGYEIYKETAKLLDDLRVSYPVRLLGISVSDLKPCSQICLFEQDEKRKKFLKFVDKIRKRYGRKKIFPLAIKNLL